MNWDWIEGNWKLLQGRAKQQWGKLTDDDLTEIAGKHDELAGRIQARYGVAKEEAHKQIGDWLKEPGVLDDWNDRRAI